MFVYKHALPLKSICVLLASEKKILLLLTLNHYPGNEKRSDLTHDQEGSVDSLVLVGLTHHRWVFVYKHLSLLTLQGLCSLAGKRMAIIFC